MTTTHHEPCTGEPAEATQVTIVDHPQPERGAFEAGQPALLRFIRTNAEVVDFYKGWR